MARVSPSTLGYGGQADVSSSEQVLTRLPRKRPRGYGRLIRAPVCCSLGGVFGRLCSSRFPWIGPSMDLTRSCIRPFGKNGKKWTYA